MAITWATIFAGVLVVFGLPIMLVALNARRKSLGWIVLAFLITFLFLGNVVESTTS
jgi:hypothetical protein